MKKTVVTGILAAALLLSAVPGAGAALTETPLTRGEFITCLYQADLDRQESGKGATDPPPCDVMGEMTAVYLRYADVSLDSELAVPAAWASFCGIAAYWDNKDINFAPERKITREEAALMLLRYAQSLGYAPHCWRQEVLPEDAGEISPWAAGATYWALENGIFSRSGSGDAQARALVTHSDLEGALVSLEESLVDEPINRGYFAHLILLEYDKNRLEIDEHIQEIEAEEQRKREADDERTEVEDGGIILDGPPVYPGILPPQDVTNQYSHAARMMASLSSYESCYEAERAVTLGEGATSLWLYARHVGIEEKDVLIPDLDQCGWVMEEGIDWAIDCGLISSNDDLNRKLSLTDGQALVDGLFQLILQEI